MHTLDKLNSRQTKEPNSEVTEARCETVLLLPSCVTMDEPLNLSELNLLSLKSAHSEETKDVKTLSVTTHCVGAAVIITLSLWVSREPSTTLGQGKGPSAV